MGKKNLISVLDMKDQWPDLVDLAIKLKAERGHHGAPLAGKTLAMMFEKPSTRTRTSFDVAITELGGHALYLDVTKMQMGHGETVEDTARVLSRFVHGIMYRAFDYKMMDKLGEWATVPVISGLDDLEHPCQALADMVTIKEKLGSFRGKKIVYLGDGNNVCNSLLYASAIMGIDMVACCPATRMPNAEIMLGAANIAAENGSKIVASHDPQEACVGADVLYTDTWISMGDDTPVDKAIKLFQMYQINDELLSIANPGCIVMHCLPAHRGQEITNEVIEGPHSVVFDQAENRLHAQKAVLYTLLKD
ncbi:Ornithine carbamoyltransferase [Candidatus Methanomethylophilus alvi Mx1201]|jgi:ornithine carbamoyltransferase|uniref:Ornithine carbamoyltransferase n=2 Tax=Methanomethylophilus alvi TaxID=1291540 RepID=M9SBG4_METAX|nr:ornithine carbamoyltransferase [Methanomethylophilus alvi]CDF30182.1 ornithine carbamoyltransferase catabolic [Methanoculleus sp. CAG:1088]AGI85139.1 Ornithine carbamoyltransferase [Candidatus Methanomethylophilus alvi Mx1201]AYQ54570.1 ornithine carbamoyltransferase [Methanomethylophilus alvi]MCI5973846.1 ornithine carbamoyltransferase [Methanomethylophilus alvi]MDD7480436.1 ornithine carbamoyltransferase [Methanomethylophilus alvi]